MLRLGKQQRFLRNHVNSHLARQDRGQLVGMLAVDIKVTLVNGMQTGNDAHERGFPRPVASQEGVNLAGLKNKINTFKDSYIPEELPDAVCFNELFALARRLLVRHN